MDSKQLENQEVPFEMSELVEYISEKTGVSAETIQVVFDAEEEFMRAKGIIEE